MVAIIVGFMTGLITAMFGVGWFDGDLTTAALYNLPWCLLGAMISVSME